MCFWILQLWETYLGLEKGVEAPILPFSVGIVIVGHVLV